MNNFYTFCPSLAIQNDHYNPEDFKFLASLEDRHFWFCARNRLINWGIQNYCSEKKSLLEIGCGTGFVLSNIQKFFPSLSVTGSDIYLEPLPYAQKRLSSKTFLFQMDAQAIPFKKEFDLICAFDVLEHIKDDEKVILKMRDALKEKGSLILTVPQHLWLWSNSDIISGHVRRYKKFELENKLKNAGFHIQFSSSFVFFLLPLMIISRLKSRKKYNPNSELILGRVTNFILEKILNFEVFLIKLGFRFPIGGTRFIVATK